MFSSSSKFVYWTQNVHLTILPIFWFQRQSSMEVNNELQRWTFQFFLTCLGQLKKLVYYALDIKSTYICNNKTHLCEWRSAGACPVWRLGTCPGCSTSPVEKGLMNIEKNVLVQLTSCLLPPTLRITGPEKCQFCYKTIAAIYSVSPSP